MEVYSNGEDNLKHRGTLNDLAWADRATWLAEPRTYNCYTYVFPGGFEW